METVKFAGTFAAAGAVKFQVTGLGEIVILELVAVDNVLDDAIKVYTPA